MDRDMDRVVPLDKLTDFDVAEGDPDIRGWDVIAGDGRRIGEVDELLIDTEAMKVRYMDVDLDEEVLGEPVDDESHILIPIGYARLREAEDKVIVPELDSDSLRSIPAYDGVPVTQDVETELRRHFDPSEREGPEAGDRRHDAARFRADEPGSAAGGRPGPQPGDVVVRERAIVDRDADDPSRGEPFDHAR